MLFNERKREAEIRFGALIADQNIPHEIAEDILSWFQHIGKDPMVNIEKHEHESYKK